MIMSYTILHYGKEWLRWSIRSVIDQVDEAHIFYTPYPSHGHSTAMANPETRDMLRDEIMDYLGNKLFWHDCGRFEHEGYHREYAARVCAERGANILLVVDADEIWPPDVLSKVLEICSTTEVHSFRINMRHFWRSLKWVCDDPSCPTRVIKPYIYDNSEAYLPGKVFHMGYAQTPDIIKYKISIHGHLSEWRPGWYEDKFISWHPGIDDVHPTCRDNFWNPVPYEDDGTLERLVAGNKFWDKDIIS